MAANGNDVLEVARPIVHISEEGLGSVVSLNSKWLSLTFMLIQYLDPEHL
jgi:hypothetical protein